MDEIGLIKLNYKYQMWFHRINRVHFNVDSEVFEYTRNDIELNAYNTIVNNYTFLKCDYNDKLNCLKMQRGLIKFVIRQVRGKNEAR